MNLRADSILGLCAAVCLSGCASDLVGEGETGAAHPGVRVQLASPPKVDIDDEFETQVDLTLELDHLGGPSAQSFEVVAATLDKDLMPFADIELAIPEGHDPFAPLAEGESTSVRLRGSVPQAGSDWGLCASGPDEASDELRVTLDLALRIMPGANDEADDIVFESLAVDLNCVFIG